MKKIFFLTVFVIQACLLNAQQLPIASYYMYDYTRTNPGSIGSKDMVCISAIYSQDFVGFEGAPQTWFFNASTPFKLFGAKHGVGMSIYQDKYGLYDDIDFKLGYAYRFNVGDGTLGIGLSGGFLQKSLNTSELKPVDDDFTGIPRGAQDNIFTFNLGAGLFYRSEDIYFGASVSNINMGEVKYNSESGEAATEKLVPHYHITAGYNMALSNPAYEIIPSLSFISDGRIVEFDFNATLMYNKKLWGGVSYRTGSAVVGMAGISILDGLKIGYAYDLQTSALAKKSNGSHEILVNYCFKIGVEKPPQKYKSIRFL